MSEISRRRFLKYGLGAMAAGAASAGAAGTIWRKELERIQGGTAMKAIVETSYGKLEGEQQDNMCVFRGIPFAKPPVDTLRFRPPQIPDSWEGSARAPELAGMGMTAILAGGFFPVIDGQVLPRSTYVAIRDGETAGIPIVVGTTLDEERLFDILDPSIAKLDEAGLLTRAEAMAPRHGQLAVDTYRNARKPRGESVTPPVLYSAMKTDKGYRYPTMRLGEFQAQLTPDTYAYLFSWYKSPVKGGALGAFHGIDVPFQFQLDDSWFTPDSRAGAEALSTKIQDAWLAFARTGNPSHEGLPAWPTYDASRRATMILDEVCQEQDAPREPERHFWETIG